jgi:hypothetical protein
MPKDGVGAFKAAETHLLGVSDYVPVEDAKALRVDGGDPLADDANTHAHGLTVADLLEDGKHTHHKMTRDAHTLGMADFADRKTGAGADLAAMEAGKAAEVKSAADHAARLMERNVMMRQLEERQRAKDVEAAHAKAHGESMRAMSHGLLEAVAKHNKEEEARREAAAWELSLALFAKQRREAKMWFDLRPHFEKTTKWQKRHDPARPRFDPSTGVALNRAARALLASLTAQTTAAAGAAAADGAAGAGAGAGAGGAGESAAGGGAEGARGDAAGGVAAEGEAAAAVGGGADGDAAASAGAGFDDSHLHAAAEAAAAAASGEVKAAARAALARQKELDSYVPPPPPEPRYDPQTGVGLNQLAYEEVEELERLISRAGFAPFGEEQEGAMGGGSAAGWLAWRRRQAIVDDASELRNQRSEIAEAARLAAAGPPTFVNFLGRTIVGEEPNPALAVYDKVTDVPLNRPARKERQLFIEWGRRRAPPDPRYDPKTGVPLNKQAREEFARKNDGREWILA